MRVQRYLISIFIALMMLFSAVGCSSQSSAQAVTQPASSAQVEQGITEEPASAEGEKVAQADGQSAAGTGEESNTEVLPDGILKVHFVDVGQADSILIQSPAGKSLLIDAGNNDDDAAVIKYIKDQAITKLDIVIGTHPHEDHIGGSDAVIKAFDVGQVVMPRATHTSETYKDVLTAISDKGLKITEAKAGLNLDLGADINVQVLAPNHSSYDELNNYSVVVKLTFGKTSFLFAGDAENLSEKEMIAAGYDLESDLLKVGHHGSDTSSSVSFLNKVKPSFAVISVGENNSYGHPAQTALDNLKAVGAKIYRTDQAGTIVAESDGVNIALNAVPSEIKPRAPDQESTHVVPGEKPATVVPVAPTSPAHDVTVYITKTGEKYHQDGCRYLSKSKIPIGLSAVKNKGYTPCSVCDPPQ